MSPFVESWNSTMDRISPRIFLKSAVFIKIDILKGIRHRVVFQVRDIFISQHLNIRFPCSIQLLLCIQLKHMSVSHSYANSDTDRIQFVWGHYGHFLSQRSPVTSNTAAKLCQEMGTSLLTIHSSTEYQFIEDTFLETLGTSTLYVVVKREVICICVLYVCASPSKWYCDICLGSLFSGVGSGMNLFNYFVGLFCLTCTNSAM